MFSFLAEFTRDAASPRTIIVLDDEGLEEPRRYRVLPRSLLVGFGLTVLISGLAFVALLLGTPLRGLVPGIATAGMKSEARMNELRLQAMEDSLTAQDEYLGHLRNLMLGRVEPEDPADGDRSDPRQAISGGIVRPSGEPSSENWEDHQQPALPFSTLSAEAGRTLPVAATDRYLSSLRFPAQPPVSGLLTRGFDARSGHFAIDLAISEGTLVRSIGDGYVILADWTHDGGHVLAVQHADGFVSVYKHNQQLLKRAGDRVRDREGIALSGNTGEVTTGPHVHFELWYDGLAQDPAAYLLR